MESDPFRHEYAGQTTLHPVGLAALVVLGVAMLLVPRRYAVWPMAIMACFIAPAQRVVILGANFDMLRLMLIFGWLRVMIRSEYVGFVVRRPDVAVAAWTLMNMTTVTFASGSLATLMNSLGDVYDVMGMYLLFRFLIRTWDDVHRATLGFIWISIPVAAAFVVESKTGRNLFAFLGGVPADTLVREGKMRCQGAFAHPILAGCFWASLLPMIAVRWFLPGRWKLLTAVGCANSILIVILCNSSTPIAGVMFGVVGAAFYLLRRWMRLVRWSIAIAVLVLHLFVMNGPVWHLLSRIDLSGGSDAYHRQMLIDQALAHADEWWLVGSNIGSAHWGFLTADMTNLYIVQGLHGGVGLIALFVLIICFGFADVGRMMRDSQDQKHVNRCAWALGICLFIHVMNFVAVSYFGQINMIWYMLLATIASLAPLGAKLPFKASRTPSAKLAGATTKRPARSARPARVAVLDEEIHRVPRQDARTV